MQLPSPRLIPKAKPMPIPTLTNLSHFLHKYQKPVNIGIVIVLGLVVVLTTTKILVNRPTPQPLTLFQIQELVQQNHSTGTTLTPLSPEQKLINQEVSILRKKTPLSTNVFTIDFDYHYQHFNVTFSNSSPSNHQNFSTWLESNSFNHIPDEYFVLIDPSSVKGTSTDSSSETQTETDPTGVASVQACTNGGGIWNDQIGNSDWCAPQSTYISGPGCLCPKDVCWSGTACLPVSPTAP